MNTRNLMMMLATAVAAGAAGWYIARNSNAAHPPAGGQTAGRKVAFYQSAMHPWIKSDQPGRCTICGMPLTPVYEGESGLSTSADLISLSESQINVLNVQTTSVRKGPLQRTLRVSGTLEDDATRHRILSATIEGRIEQLFVQYPGAEVVEGQPLAVFHSPELLALEREYNSVVNQLKTADADQGIELQRLKSAARQRLQLYGLSMAQIEGFEARSADAHLFEINAPISGTVVSRDVYAGQYVQLGEKLFELADFSTMWFQFDAYEQDLAWLRPGLPVDVTTPSRPGRIFKGSIRFIDPNFNAPTRTTKVRVELSNPLETEGGHTRRPLSHRAFARGSVSLEAPDVLLAPRRAVLNPNGRPVVYVDKGEGHYQQRQVSLGRFGDEDWEVLSGLEEGERVVTTGNLMIDSQAQLNASHLPQEPAPSQAPSGPPLPPLTSLQQSNLLAVLGAADVISDALASDLLEKYNQALAPLGTSVRTFEESVQEIDDWKTLAAELTAAAPTGIAASLQDARKAYHTLSIKLLPVGRAVRGREGFEQVRFFQCPMTRSAFPGAPAKASWLQLRAALRNPYFGAEMLDCGSEIKP